MCIDMCIDICICYGPLLQTSRRVYHLSYCYNIYPLPPKTKMSPKIPVEENYGGPWALPIPTPYACCFVVFFLHLSYEDFAQSGDELGF